MLLLNLTSNFRANLEGKSNLGHLLVDFFLFGVGKSVVFQNHSLEFGHRAHLVREADKLVVVQVNHFAFGKLGNAGRNRRDIVSA